MTPGGRVPGSTAKLLVRFLAAEVDLTSELDDQRTVHRAISQRASFHCIVLDVVEDDEQAGTCRLQPAEAHVSGEIAGLVVVLQQRLQVDARCKGVGSAQTNQRRMETARPVEVDIVIADAQAGDKGLSHAYVQRRVGALAMPG